ncbi:hypothetical protein AC1031_013304, partial [Aphanomyces cochlioides]
MDRTPDDATSGNLSPRLDLRGEQSVGKDVTLSQVTTEKVERAFVECEKLLSSENTFMDDSTADKTCHTFFEMLSTLGSSETPFDEKVLHLNETIFSRAANLFSRKGPAASKCHSFANQSCLLGVNYLYTHASYINSLSNNPNVAVAMHSIVEYLMSFLQFVRKSGENFDLNLFVLIWKNATKVCLTFKKLLSSSRSEFHSKDLVCHAEKCVVECIAQLKSYQESISISP